MEHKRIGVGLAACLLLPALAPAEPAYLEKGARYGGAHFAMGRYDEQGVSATARPKAMVARFGEFVEDRFAIEGRAGFGLGSDTVTVEGFDVDVQIDNMAAAYLLGHVPLGEQATAYALSGMTHGRMTVSIGSVSASATDTGLTWGAGLNVHSPDSELVFNVEYARYLDGGTYTLSAISFGLAGAFGD